MPSPPRRPRRIICLFLSKLEIKGKCMKSSHLTSLNSAMLKKPNFPGVKSESQHELNKNLVINENYFCKLLDFYICISKCTINKQ